MSQNIISLVLTDAQIKAAMDALTALEGALTGLISKTGSGSLLALASRNQINRQGRQV